MIDDEWWLLTEFPRVCLYPLISVSAVILRSDTEGPPLGPLSLAPYSVRRLQIFIKVCISRNPRGREILHRTQNRG